MKTNFSSLQFGTYISKSGPTSKKMSIDDDDDDYETEENPWLCCKCGNGNNGEVSLCDICGHDKCAHCPEI
jgi:hypothetical protein